MHLLTITIDGEPLTKDAVDEILEVLGRDFGLAWDTKSRAFSMPAPSSNAVLYRLSSVLLGRLESFASAERYELLVREKRPPGVHVVAQLVGMDREGGHWKQMLWLSGYIEGEPSGENRERTDRTGIVGWLDGWIRRHTRYQEKCPTRVAREGWAKLGYCPVEPLDCALEDSPRRELPPDSAVPPSTSGNPLHISCPECATPSVPGEQSQPCPDPAVDLTVLKCLLVAPRRCYTVWLGQCPGCLTIWYAIRKD